MFIWIAVLACLLLIRLMVGAPTRPEQWMVRAVARRRDTRPYPARR